MGWWVKLGFWLWVGYLFGFLLLKLAANCRVIEFLLLRGCLAIFTKWYLTIGANLSLNVFFSIYDEIELLECFLFEHSQVDRWNSFRDGFAFVKLLVRAQSRFLEL